MNKYRGQVLTVYKHLLWSADRLEKSLVKAGLAPHKELRRFVYPGALPDFRDSHLSLYDAVRHQFRANRNVIGEDLDSYVNLGFEALRRVNERRNQLLNPNWTPKPENVKFSVGDIVAHRKLAYRAVIFGWDTECVAKATENTRALLQGLKNGPKQPFYLCLLHDGPAGSGGKTYVAEENLAYDSTCKPVVHPEITAHFDAYVPLPGGFYVANEDLQRSYPEDLPAP